MESDAPLRDETFRHEALLYDGDRGFLEATVPFITEGLQAGQDVMVAVRPQRLELLRSALEAAADEVQFVDMSDVGANPARIIPAWKAFMDHRSAPTARGIGEPIWAGRSPAELIECQIHESLLNITFGLADPLWLLCPYDVSGLDGGVVDEARRSHPHVSRRDDGSADPGGYATPTVLPANLSLPQPPPASQQLVFGPGDVHAVRDRVGSFARRVGLGLERAFDFALAAGELATNSILHGGGAGTLRIWRDGNHVVIEISDRGRLADPLAGRRAPDVQASGRRGLWIVNQLCDLVQIRAFPTGSVVRAHMAIARA